jgi:hypothetical protein
MIDQILFWAALAIICVGIPLRWRWVTRKTRLQQNAPVNKGGHAIVPHR